MAGKKGRSGGARDGSGPKPKPIQTLEANSDEPMEFLRQVMQEKAADGALRVRAAIALGRLEKVARPGTPGKKSLTTNAAKEAAGGKFAPSAPPKLNS